MKTSRKIAILALTLCLTPCLASAKVVKIQDYKGINYAIETGPIEQDCCDGSYCTLKACQYANPSNCRSSSKCGGQQVCKNIQTAAGSATKGTKDCRIYNKYSYPSGMTTGATCWQETNKNDTLPDGYVWKFNCTDSFTSTDTKCYNGSREQYGTCGCPSGTFELNMRALTDLLKCNTGSPKAADAARILQAGLSEVYPKVRDITDIRKLISYFCAFQWKYQNSSQTDIVCVNQDVSDMRCNTEQGFTSLTGIPSAKLANGNAVATMTSLWNEFNNVYTVSGRTSETSHGSYTVTENEDIALSIDVKRTEIRGANKSVPDIKYTYSGSRFNYRSDSYVCIKDSPVVTATTNGGTSWESINNASSPGYVYSEPDINSDFAKAANALPLIFKAPVIYGGDAKYFYANTCAEPYSDVSSCGTNAEEKDSAKIKTVNAEIITCRKCEDTSCGVGLITDTPIGLITDGTGNNAYFTKSGCNLRCNSAWGDIQLNSSDNTLTTAISGLNGKTGQIKSAVANSTIKGKMDVKFAYSFQSFVDGSYSLLCGQATGCAASAGYIPTTCDTGSWCSWFNN
ncbi:MAG: hypothetical protein IJ184_04450 [Alphaproteobacteria bacterium]|nr:hypothetical protein [Alphaproteobacteria bacterium]